MLLSYELGLSVFTFTAAKITNGLISMWRAAIMKRSFALAVNFGFAEPEFRDNQRLVEEHCEEVIELIFVSMAGVEELTSSMRYVPGLKTGPSGLDYQISV